MLLRENLEQLVKKLWRKAASQGQIFHGVSEMWHRPVWSIGAGCHIGADAAIDFLAEYDALLTPNSF